MKQTERASIFRIVADLIIADAIIDIREMETLGDIREKYAIKQGDETLGASYTLARAVKTLLEAPKSIRDELMSTVLAICDVRQLLCEAGGFALVGITSHHGS